MAAAVPAITPRHGCVLSSLGVGKPFPEAAQRISSDDQNCQHSKSSLTSQDLPLTLREGHPLLGHVLVGVGVRVEKAGHH